MDEEQKKILLPHERLIEQKITKQVTVASSATGYAEVPIPVNRTAYLKGYGYKWYADTTVQLITGNTTFPSRTDQEGSPAMPVLYGTPFKCREGGTLKLAITNGSAASHTYDVVFYILTSELLPINSVGSELVVPTAAGGLTGAVAVYDSSFATSANVTAKGLAVNPQSPTTLLCGTKSTTAATALALAASTAIKKVTVQSAITNTEEMYIGNASAQLIVLGIGQSIDIEIDDLAKIYIKRTAATNVTANYIAS